MSSQSDNAHKSLCLHLTLYLQFLNSSSFVMGQFSMEFRHVLRLLLCQTIFSRCLHSKQPWKVEVVCLSEAESRFYFLRSMSHTHTHSVHSFYVGCSETLLGTERARGTKSTVNHMLPAVLQIIKSFVSGLHKCLPTFMNL